VKGICAGFGINMGKLQVDVYRKTSTKLFTFEYMIKVKDYITIDPEILGGQPVFKNTRVPVETLFGHLEKGISLEEFLDDFPSVTQQQAVAVLEIANKILTSGNIEQLYETAA
jgi:uncharacterized protein (DUF433 family)